MQIKSIGHRYELSALLRVTHVLIKQRRSEYNYDEVSPQYITLGELIKAGQSLPCGLFLITLLDGFINLRPLMAGGTCLMENLFVYNCS
jgi:hypothetical protein